MRRLFRFPLALGSAVFAGLDWLDAHRARRRRQTFGQRGWLLSWSRDADGRWRARLSGPEFPRTIERSASNRVKAIERAAQALTLLGTLHGRFGRLLDLPHDPGPGRYHDVDPNRFEPT
ncbi:MAG: hypothetical protein AB7I30_04655 [Isosphaeraceae bacterium]